MVYSFTMDKVISKGQPTMCPYLPIMEQPIPFKKIMQINPSQYLAKKDHFERKSLNKVHNQNTDEFDQADT